MRLWEMATLQTYGARYVKDVTPFGLACYFLVDGQDLWVDVWQEPGLLHLVFEDGAVHRRQGLHGDKDVGARPGHRRCR